MEKNALTTWQKTVVRAYLDASLRLGCWLKYEELKEAGLGYCVILDCGGLMKVREAAQALFPEEAMGLLEIRQKQAQRTAARHEMELIEAYMEASLAAGYWLTTCDLKGVVVSQRVSSGEVVSLSYHRLLRYCGGIVPARRAAEQRFPEVIKALAKTEAQQSAVMQGSGMQRNVSMQSLGAKWKTQPKMTRAWILERYYQESVKRGCWLNSTQIRANPMMPSHETYRKYFTNVEALRQAAEKKFEKLPYEGLLWSGLQNATLEEECYAKKYYDESRAAAEWLLSDQLPQKVVMAFGGMARVRRHVIAKYGDWSQVE